MSEFRQQRYAPPPGALDLLLVRHGASAPYVPGRSFELVDGHGDPELAPEGREQAARVAARLAGEGVAAVYVTNLRRTAETAAPLLRLTGMTATVEPGLREVYLGEWEGGLLRQRFAEQDPIALQVMGDERWDRIPGAEPAEVFAERVRAAVVRLAAAHPDQRVVAFTHGGVIGELLHQASGSRPFAFSGAENGSISQLVVAGDRWVVRRFNDTAHFTPGFAVSAEPLE
jgi:probable phosphoglycerate mutase